MVLTWLARAAAVLGLACWALMDFAITAAGGPGESGLEDPFFWLGVVLLAVACAALGQQLMAGRTGSQRAIGILVALVAGAAIVLICAGVSRAVTPKSWGWFRSDLGMLAGAALIVVIALCVYDVRRRVQRRRKERAGIEAREPQGHDRAQEGSAESAGADTGSDEAADRSDGPDAGARR